ncbi:MAG: RDD family protein [Candidatus Aenigmatarchaeota archaeon]
MKKLIRVGFWRRFWAHMLDWLFLNIVVLIALVVSSMLLGAAYIDETPDTFVALLYIGGTALTLLYFTFMEGRRGQTLGKMAAGIIVVGEDGRKISYGQALLRRIGLLIPFFNIIDALCILRQSKQRIFDNVARTIVVEVKK